MQSLSKPYNVSKMYLADVMGKVYEIDVMDTVYEVDVTGNSGKEGPLDNVSKLKQAITLATPPDTYIKLLPHKYSPHKSISTTAQFSKCLHWPRTK